MNQFSFNELMERKRMKIVGQSAGGMEGDFPIWVTMTYPKVWTVSVSVEIDDWKSLRKELKDAGLKYSYVYENGHLTGTIRLKDSNYQETYEQFLEGTTTFLRHRGLRAPQSCPFCGQGGCNALVLRKGGYDAVHQTCLDTGLAQIEATAKASEVQGNYFTGILGGLLGAAVGIIPSIFTILVVEKIYALLYALIPLAIYQGYKMCKGKLNKMSIVITVLLSIVGVYLIQIVLLSVSLMDEFQITLFWAIQLTFALLADPTVWGELTSGSIMDFVFVALGIWIAWSRISRTGSATVRTVGNVRETVAPLGPDGLAADFPQPSAIPEPVSHPAQEQSYSSSGYGSENL